MLLKAKKKQNFAKKNPNYNVNKKLIVPTEKENEHDKKKTIEFKVEKVKNIQNDQRNDKLELLLLLILSLTLFEIILVQ